MKEIYRYLIHKNEKYSYLCPVNVIIILYTIVNNSKYLIFGMYRKIFYGKYYIKYYLKNTKYV